MAKTLNVGMIGYKFMGKAHSNAWLKADKFFDLKARPIMKMIEAGDLGKIYHYRARYAQDWIVDPNFPLVWRLQSQIAGSGTHGDINAHIIDIARYLVGEFSEVCGQMETFIKERPLPKDQ